jgi:DNA-binding XRE family transcriptional regulator
MRATPNIMLLAAIAMSGKTQRELAHEIGIAPESLSRIVRQHCKPQTTTARAIAAALDTTPDALGIDREGGAL